MSAALKPEQLAHLQTVFAEWDIPPVTAIEAVLEGHSIYRVSTEDLVFTLKDISDAPNVLRLECTYIASS